ncbi:MAG: terminase small subunit [Cycloclasticus sp.]|jgi:Phage terminase, small subunit
MNAGKKRQQVITPKLKMACCEYIIDLNWVAAMMRAGYKESTARNRGSDYFKRPDVQALVAELSAQRIKGIESSADDVIEELEYIAFGNVMDVFEYQVDADDPNSERVLGIKDLEKLPKSATATISSIKVTPATAYTAAKTEIKFHNKLNALELLGRHHQVFEKTNKGGVDFVLEMDLGGDNG